MKVIKIKETSYQDEIDAMKIVIDILESEIKKRQVHEL